MSISFTDLIRSKKKLHVDFAGHRVGFEYAPGAWTASQERDWRLKQLRMSRRLAENDESAIEESISLKYEFLKAYLISWEIDGDDNKSLPITDETLAAFPASFTNAIFDAIDEDRDPNRRKRGS
jgi:hypothetical protein